MIEVSGLVKLYGERQVLHGLDFSVPVGRVCGFLGPNGSGKSTTMDILAALLGPSGGSVKICGHDVVTQPKQVKACVGYLPDNPPLHREMTVESFVQYVGKLRGFSGQDLKGRVQTVMADCDVTDVAHRVIGNLSKGYRQRVALCAALVHKPQVLILDEPTEGLDPNQIVHIRHLIRKLSQDRTVILSSHILSEVQATCDDVIIINQGTIAAKTSLTDQASQHPQYRYCFPQGMQSSLEWLRKQPQVESVTGEDKNTVLVQFNASAWSQGIEAVLAQLNGQLFQSGHVASTIQEHRTGLESLFFDVIKSQSSVAASNDAVAQA